MAYESPNSDLEVVRKFLKSMRGERIGSKLAEKYGLDRRKLPDLCDGGWVPLRRDSLLRIRELANDIRKDEAALRRLFLGGSDKRVERAESMNTAEAWMEYALFRVKSNSPFEARRIAIHALNKAIESWSMASYRTHELLSPFLYVNLRVASPMQIREALTRFVIPMISEKKGYLGSPDSRHRVLCQLACILNESSFTHVAIEGFDAQRPWLSRDDIELTDIGQFHRNLAHAHAWIGSNRGEIEALIQRAWSADQQRGNELSIANTWGETALHSRDRRRQRCALEKIEPTCDKVRRELPLLLKDAPDGPSLIHSYGTLLYGVALKTAVAPAGYRPDDQASDVKLLTDCIKRAGNHIQIAHRVAPDVDNNFPKAIRQLLANAAKCPDPGATSFTLLNATQKAVQLLAA